MTTDTRPIVGLGVPCGDRVHQEFTQCMWGLARGAKNHRQGIIFAQSSMIVNARNQIIDGAQQINAAYIMFLDSDMTFPYKIVDQLLAHDKDIIGCTYVRRGPPFDNLGHTLDPKDMKERAGLVEMTHMPTGLLLVKTSVFDKFTKPWFRFAPNETTGITEGEDMVFSRQAREKGFRLWCDLDLSMECAHLYQYALRPTDPAVREVTEAYKSSNGKDKKRLILSEAAHG